MLDEKAREMFVEWGRKGGKAKAKRYTRKQISNMAKRGKRKRRRA